MNLKTVDWISLLSFVASGGLATLAQLLAQTWPGQATTIINIAAIAAALAGVLVRLFSNKTGAPASAITADAAIVPSNTTVVHADTPVVATNISSTSTLLKGNK